MIKRKTLDKNGEEKNMTKKVKRKTLDKNGKEKNTGHKW